jgi:TonB family protein
MIAVLAAPAAAQSGRVSGSLTDPSGAVLPAVEVRALLRDENGETVRSVITDSKGTYQIEGMTPGQWVITASLPGFETATRRQILQNGDSIDWSPTLELGMLQETITITTGSPQNEPARTVIPAPAEPPAPLAARAAPAGAVRVGGSIKATRKLVNVNPIYPADAAAQGLSGVVILRATIAPDGSVRDIETLRSPNESLTLSATNALYGWQFSPTLLNGEPVAARMTATFNFTQQ